jgi:hypothetical protein
MGSVLRLSTGELSFSLARNLLVLISLVSRSNDNCGACGNKCPMGLSCLGDSGCTCFSNLGPDPNLANCTLGNGTVNQCRDLSNEVNYRTCLREKLRSAN